MRSLLSAFGGAAVTLALVLSCSDDSPGDADAAENCEPPLEGRITRVDDTKTNQSGTLVGATAICASGATLLGGGCEVGGQNDSTLVLNKAGSTLTASGYGCQWQNPMSITVETVHAWAVCLRPAP